jgi:hypothetical protein
MKLNQIWENQAEGVKESLRVKKIAEVHRKVLLFEPKKKNGFKRIQQ